MSYFLIINEILNAYRVITHIKSLNTISRLRGHTIHSPMYPVQLHHKIGEFIFFSFCEWFGISYFWRMRNNFFMTTIFSNFWIHKYAEKNVTFHSLSHYVKYMHSTQEQYHSKKFKRLVSYLQWRSQIVPFCWNFYLLV